MDFSNGSAHIILVLDELVQFETVLGSVNFGDMLRKLSEFLEPGLRFYFLVSSLSSRISMTMRTDSGRALHPVSLSQLDKSTAYRLVEQQLVKANLPHLIEDMAVRCAVVECFGVPRFLTQLSATLIEYGWSPGLQTLRSELAKKLAPDRVPTDWCEGLACCFCLPVHLHSNPALLTETRQVVHSNSTLLPAPRKQSEIIRDSVFYLEEKGLLFKFSTPDHPVVHGIPSLVLASLRNPSGVLEWVAPSGNDDNIPGNYLNRKLEDMVALGVRMLHWRDRICAGVFGGGTYDHWVLQHRQTTTVAQLFNLAAIKSLTLCLTHTAHSVLHLCGSEMVEQSLRGSSFQTVRRRANQFLLLKPENKNYSGCDLIVAAPMAHSYEDFFLVFECKMTEEPSDNRSPLGKSGIAAKFRTCLSSHPLLLDAFLNKRLCYFVGGMRPFSSNLEKEDIRSLLLEAPPAKASTSQPPKRSLSNKSPHPPAKASSPVQKASPRRPENKVGKSQNIGSNSVVTKKTPSWLPKNLSADEVEELCEQSVISLDRANWKQILTPTLAFRPQFDSSFTE